MAERAFRNYSEENI